MYMQLFVYAMSAKSHSSIDFHKKLSKNKKKKRESQQLEEGISKNT